MWVCATILEDLQLNININGRTRINTVIKSVFQSLFTGRKNVPFLTKYISAEGSRGSYFVAGLFLTDLSQFVVKIRPRTAEKHKDAQNKIYIFIEERKNKKDGVSGTIQNTTNGLRCLPFLMDLNSERLKFYRIMLFFKLSCSQHGQRVFSIPPYCFVTRNKNLSLGLPDWTQKAQ